MATPDVVLGFAPGVLLVTAKDTVQTPLAGRLIPEKFNTVAPVIKVPPDVAPEHVPLSAVPDDAIFTSVSENAAPLSGMPLLLDSVRITDVFAPD